MFFKIVLKKFHLAKKGCWLVVAGNLIINSLRNSHMTEIIGQNLIEKLSLLNFHSAKLKELYQELDSDDNGLDEEQAQIKLEQFGPNKLKEKKGYSIFSLLIDQFKDLLVIILLIAGFFSFIVGEHIDAIAIFAIVIVNGLLGFFQEFKAEKSMEALKKMETLEARVWRNNKEITVDAEKIVPGDIIALYEGEKVPADARLIEAHSLEVDESMLTGESLPVAKEIGNLPNNLALADRKNMVYSGCVVTKGRARALVVMTGMNTEIGKIATQIQETEEGLTPLQKALEKLGKVLGFISLGVAIPGLVLGIVFGRDVIEMLMMAISLAVSAIPEGLPIVVTIALALGIKRMVKVNVLVRKLSTAEALGGTDVICSDKTGTITHNQMTVTDIYIPKVGLYKVSGSGYDTDGKITWDKKANTQLGIKGTGNEQALTAVVENSVLASDATFDFGDPTEKSLVVALRKLSLHEDSLRQKCKRLDEIPFNSADKFMAVTVEKNNKQIAILKGAPEIVFDFCALSKQEKTTLSKINENLALQGLRVLAIAEKTLASGKKMKQLADYQLTALIGMYDPPREAVKESIKLCHGAGIRVVMITGDHKNTAEAIAKKIGLDSAGVLTGNDIDAMDENDFKKKVESVNIYARVSPKHKVQILTTLQELGHQVAMTGDGVNDAPAIKKADVGIAVGSGTDLTKGISDLILLDDDFSTIPKAIKEGRRIFFNIKKFVRFLISANFDEILAIFTAIIFKLPLLFLPIQILWLNLATDSLPALALTTDVAEKDIMQKKPYHPDKEILHGVLPFSLLAASIAYLATFGLYLLALFVWKLPTEHARTLAFTSTVMFEFFLVFTIRSDKSAFKIGIFSNKLLLLAVVLGVTGQIFAVEHPLGNQIFKTIPLSAQDWGLVLISASSGFVILETLKLIKSKVPSLAKYIPIN